MHGIMILPVKGLEIKRSFYIVRHKKRSLPPIVRAFSRFLYKQR